MADVREPIIAGTFYPSDKAKLQEMVQSLLTASRERPRFRIVIAPHAGYGYSGRTAAKAIASFQKPESLVVAGPNHTGVGGLFSIMKSGEWKTPLGTVPVDTKLAEALLAPPMQADPLAHMEEHSVEALLPILQVRLGSFNFVPMCVMNISYDDAFLEDCTQVGEILAGINGLGLVASTDFSHYVPFETARNKDIAVIDRIMDMDPEGMFQALRRNECSVCGYGPIAIAMVMADRLGLKPEVISSTSSSDVNNDRDSVVTYHAIGFG